MSKLPVLSGAKLIKILGRMGYYIRGQEGSHIHLRHPWRKSLTVPNHKIIARGTFRFIIKETGMSKNEFLKLLKK
ncbi:MAG: type II toxin-antitoxin system HicA family toxin [Elusimicrobiota bacterium]|nr:type II toxin-antitoxin system HicA family toxin [Elusimicrobiota bacterium]